MSALRWIWARLQAEPAAAQSTLQAALALAIGFGLDWTAQQEALILAFTAALGGLFLRQVSTPNASLSGSPAPPAPQDGPS